MPVTVSPGLQRGAAACDFAARLLLENHAAIDDDVFVGDVELGDAAGDLLADKSFEFGGVARAAAAGGHEGADADVDAQAALDDGGDGAGDGDFLSKGGFERRPIARLRNAEARELVVALFIAAGDGDGKGVAGLTRFGIVLECGARQNAFHLVADVEDDLIGGERDDGAFELLGFGAMRVRALEFRKQVGKGGLSAQVLVFSLGAGRRFRSRGRLVDYGIATGLLVLALVFDCFCVYG